MMTVLTFLTTKKMDLPQHAVRVTIPIDTLQQISFFDGRQSSHRHQGTPLTL